MSQARETTLTFFVMYLSPLTTKVYRLVNFFEKPIHKAFFLLENFRRPNVFDRIKWIPTPTPCQHIKWIPTPTPAYMKGRTGSLLVTVLTVLKTNLMEISVLVQVTGLIKTYARHRRGNQICAWHLERRTVRRQGMCLWQATNWLLIKTDTGGILLRACG